VQRLVGTEEKQSMYKDYVEDRLREFAIDAQPQRVACIP
jgi:hypothetical protein